MNIFSPRHLVKRGFTLIELLVVIAIIGILSSIVTASFQQARAQARDDVRQSDLKQLQLAIELYRAQEGEYPAGCNGDDTWSGNLGTQWACSGGNENYIVGLVPDYIQQLPVEQNVALNVGFAYFVNSDRTGYKVVAHNAVEAKLVNDYENKYARCPQSFGTAVCPVVPRATDYAVYNFTGREW